MDTTETNSFGQWMQKLDTLTRRKADLSVHEINASWQERYDEGLTPDEAFDAYARDLLWPAGQVGLPLKRRSVGPRWVVTLT